MSVSCNYITLVTLACIFHVGKGQKKIYDDCNLWAGRLEANKTLIISSQFMFTGYKHDTFKFII